jgi:hypothetical protein
VEKFFNSNIFPKKKDNSFFIKRFQREGKGGFHAKNLPCTPKLHQWFPWIPVAGSTQGLIALKGRFIPISTSLQRLFYLLISEETERP